MYNNMAATARKCILKHQATINQMQEEIPKLKNELAVHEMDCAHKLYDLKWDISTVKRDVAVMTEVLKLTECKTGLLQTGQEPLKCKCQNGHHVVHFHDKSLHSKLVQIKSKTLQNRILQALQNVITQAPDLRTDKTNCADNHTRDEFSHPPVTNIAANVTVR